jgi:hypothetical protein
MSDYKLHYSNNQFELTNNISDKQINELLDSLKSKKYSSIKYQIDDTFDKIIKPDDYKVFFEDIQKFLEICGTKLTDNQICKITEYIQDYNKKYKSYRDNYNNILMEKQNICKHPEIHENNYGDYICEYCGKKW